jgi:ATP/maltotriose-dependent transcriptional regulator MalT
MSVLPSVGWGRIEGARLGEDDLLHLDGLLDVEGLFALDAEGDEHAAQQQNEDRKHQQQVGLDGRSDLRPKHEPVAQDVQHIQFILEPRDPQQHDGGHGEPALAALLADAEYDDQDQKRKEDQTDAEREEMKFDRDRMRDQAKDEFAAQQITHYIEQGEDDDSLRQPGRPSELEPHPPDHHP